jgi:Mrp family chromosome partitioning ATPase
VADAALLGAITNGVLMVVAAKRSRRADLAAALRAFDIAGVRCLGMVVTMTRSKKTTDAYGSGYYRETPSAADAGLTGTAALGLHDV